MAVLNTENISNILSTIPDFKYEQYLDHKSTLNA